ncbi:hypothetical protein CS544_01315 [Porphyromonas gingivalis]|nr:hypothetical protein CS544_01315 [Porphyromonas gingivalis]
MRRTPLPSISLFFKGLIQMKPRYFYLDLRPSYIFPAQHYVFRMHMREIKKMCQNLFDTSSLYCFTTTSMRGVASV